MDCYMNTGMNCIVVNNGASDRNRVSDEKPCKEKHILECSQGICGHRTLFLAYLMGSGGLRLV